MKEDDDEAYRLHLKEYYSEYHEKNRLKISLQKKKWYHENRERILAQRAKKRAYEKKNQGSH